MITKPLPGWVKVVRWIARGLSILIIVFTFLRAVLPAPTITEPVPAEDIFLLSLWGVAVLGLLLAWRWELAGSLLTISVMLAREAAWVLIKGNWWINFLIIWAVMLPPAVLFLAAGIGQRRAILMK